MFELAILLIPGFLWYYGNYRNHDFKNLDSSQWILVPLLLVCSSLLFLISKSWFHAIDIICPKIFSCIYIQPQALARVGHIEIDTMDFFMSVALGWLAPLAARRLRYKPFDQILNPFGQFRNESAVGRTLDSLALRREPMMLVLSDGRVYIGGIFEVDHRSSEARSISIIPWMSGAMREGILSISTSYLESFVDENGEDGVRPAAFAERFPVSLFLENAVSIRGFDLAVFLSYVEAKTIKVENADLHRVFERMINAANEKRTLERMYPQSTT